MKNLKLNDKVSLRGNNSKNSLQSMVMTVHDISNTTSKVICIWTNSSGKIETGLFDSNSLIKVNNSLNK